MSRGRGFFPGVPPTSAPTHSGRAFRANRPTPVLSITPNTGCPPENSVPQNIRCPPENGVSPSSPENWPADRPKDGTSPRAVPTAPGVPVPACSRLSTCGLSTSLSCTEASLSPHRTGSRHSALSPPPSSPPPAPGASRLRAPRQPPKAESVQEGTDARTSRVGRRHAGTAGSAGGRGEPARPGVGDVRRGRGGVRVRVGVERALGQAGRHARTHARTEGRKGARAAGALSLRRSPNPRGAAPGGRPPGRPPGQSLRSRTFWATRWDWRSRSSALRARRRCFSSALRLRLAPLTAAAAMWESTGRLLAGSAPGLAASGRREPRPAELKEAAGVPPCGRLPGGGRGPAPGRTSGVETDPCRSERPSR